MHCSARLLNQLANNTQPQPAVLRLRPRILPGMRREAGLEDSLQKFGRDAWSRIFHRDRHGVKRAARRMGRVVPQVLRGFLRVRFPRERPEKTSTAPL